MNTPNRILGVTPLVALIALFICAFTPISAQAQNLANVLAKVPLPGKATLNTVSDNVVHNGAVMAVAAFSASLSNEQVLSFYRSQWAGSGSGSNAAADDAMPGFLENAYPGWQMISRLQDNTLVLVQLSTESHGMSTGFISVSRVEAPSVPIKTKVFNDLKLLSSNVTQDGVDVSDVRVYASQQSVSQTHKRYRQRLVNDGWSLVSDTQVEHEWVAVFSRGTKRLEISFVESREVASVMVVNEMKSQ